MNLTGILAMVCAFAIAACAILYNRYEAAVDRADKAETAMVNMKSNEKVVTKYVNKIVEVEKRIPGAVRHIYSLCPSTSVPSPGSADGAAETDAIHRQVLELATDFAACRQNAEQLKALQEVLRPQL